MRSKILIEETASDLRGPILDIVRSESRTSIVHIKLVRFFYNKLVSSFKGKGNEINGVSRCINFDYPRFLTGMATFNCDLANALCMGIFGYAQIYKNKTIKVNK